MRDFRCPGLFHRHGLEYKTLNGVRIAAKRKSEEALNIMIKAIIFIKPLKNNVGRGKAQRLASGSGVPTAGAAGAAEVRCSVKAPSAGLGWAGTPGHGRDRGTSSAVFPWHPSSSGSSPCPAEQMLPVAVTGVQASSIPRIPHVLPGLPIGVLRWRGWSLKPAPVPVTDDIFMQGNKTRISDGLCYLYRQLGATDARQEVLCLNFETVSGI